MKIKKSIKDNGKNSGFTLIELLISLFIISSIFGFGYANYRGYSQRQALISVGRQMEGDFKLARNYANSGKVPDSCSSLDGYKFNWSGISKKYFFCAQCNGSCVGTLMPRNLSAYKVTFGGINPSTLLFKPLGQGTSLSQDLIITINQESLGKSVYIKVSKSGNITLQEKPFD